MQLLTVNPSERLRVLRKSRSPLSSWLSTGSPLHSLQLDTQGLGSLQNGEPMGKPKTNGSPWNKYATLGWLFTKQVFSFFSNSLPFLSFVQGAPRWWGCKSCLWTRVRCFWSVLLLRWIDSNHAASAGQTVHSWRDELYGYIHVESWYIFTTWVQSLVKTRETWPMHVNQDEWLIRHGNPTNSSGSDLMDMSAS